MSNSGLAVFYNVQWRIEILWRIELTNALIPDIQVRGDREISVTWQGSPERASFVLNRLHQQPRNIKRTPAESKDPPGFQCAVVRQVFNPALKPVSSSPAMPANGEVPQLINAVFIQCHESTRGVLLKVKCTD